MADTLQADLESAITEELEQPINDLNQLAGAGATPRVRPFRVKDIPKEELRPERAADQVAMACAGLLKAEEELIKLATDIVGDLQPYHDHQAEVQTPSNDGPLLPRLRSDAELMARLAIRIVKLCEEVRSKL